MNTNSIAVIDKRAGRRRPRSRNGHRGAIAATGSSLAALAMIATTRAD
jgi:hypothetical protein